MVHLDRADARAKVLGQRRLPGVLEQGVDVDLEARWRLSIPLAY